MEKTRLGISINLFAALLFFIGVGGSILVIAVAAGYVLFFEESVRLKRTAVKSLILIVFLVVTVQSITWITISLSSIFNALGNFDVLASMKNSPNNWYYNYLYQFLQVIPTLINNIARIFEVIIPVIFGLSAYKEKDIKIKWIDNIIDKHFIHE